MPVNSPPNPVALPPQYPARGDSLNFSTRADSYFGWFPTAWAYFESLVNWAVPVAAEAETSVARINDSYATGLIGTSFKGRWTNLAGALTTPSSVYHLGKFWILRQGIPNVSVEVPGTSSAWVELVSDGSVPWGDIDAGTVQTSTLGLGFNMLPVQTGPMPTAKYLHAAAPLSDGRVLVCGGYNGTTRVSEAHIYNPTTNTWTAVASMPTAKHQHAAATLSDGRVLVCGGYSSGGILSEAHIYNPTTNTWTAVASMPTAKYQHAAATLSDGRVLVCGGTSSSSSSEAHIYNPTTNTWTAVASMPTAKYGHAAAPLSDGRVLVCGGVNGTYLSEAHIYNPTSFTS
jgi:hypothetical protein